MNAYGAKYELVDIVFDVYEKFSLKSETRGERYQEKSDRNQQDTYELEKLFAG